MSLFVTILDKFLICSILSSYSYKREISNLIFFNDVPELSQKTISNNPTKNWEEIAKHDKRLINDRRIVFREVEHI